LVLVSWVTLFARKRFELSLLATAACGLFLASLPPIGIWATSGLAAMPFALTVFAVYERLFGDPDHPRGFQAGVFAALAGLIRADGTVWVLMLLAAAALLWLQRGPARKHLRALATTLALLVIVVGAHVGWRYGYYGDYLPNTARVKAGVSSIRLERGFNYGVSYLLTLPALALVVVAAARSWRGAAWQRVAPAFVIFVGTLAYAAWVGGDFMPMGRFLLPLVPFVAVLLGALWQRFKPAVALALTVVCIALNVLACFDVPVVPDRVVERFHFRTDREWESEIAKFERMKRRNAEREVQGKALALFVEPGESMILGAIGALGYYTNLEVYDLYGLVSPSVIAASEPLENASPGHDRRVDYSFFLDRKPTYLGNIIADVGKPLSESLPRNWNRRLGKIADVERKRIPAHSGLPTDKEILLLRLHSWDYGD